MRTLTFDAPLERVLLLGAHADDIEIGCGATLLQLVARTPSISLRWVVLSAAGSRADEARASAAAFSAGADHEIVVWDLRDGFLPYDSASATKELVEECKAFEPDLVFAPTRDDLHQDHRLLSHLTWNTFRDHVVLEYEIPKFDADLGHPNVFVAVDEVTARRKVELLHEHFPSQRDRSWFDDELFLSILRIRGVECQQRYAEAFHGRKVVIG